VAAGWAHSLAVRSDGTVWAWGDNWYGQLGDGTTTRRTTPVQVTGLSGVVAVAGGGGADAGSHSMALTSDGTVWAWGANDCGQLGDGTTVDRTTPVEVSGLSGVVAVAAGFAHSLAVKSDGTVWAWGGNWYRQLGDGTTTGRTTPVQVSGLSGVAAVAAGHAHSLGLKSDGTLWAWGGDYYGQRGTGLLPGRSTPGSVWGLLGVDSVAAGDVHSLAALMDGSVCAWGSNASGQLGDGTTTERHAPVTVSGLSDVVAVAAGDEHSLAVKSDGTVWAWGANDRGQLGDGTTVDRSAPVAVTGLSDVVAVAAGDEHSLALKSDGTVWAWGNNTYGRLGDGTTTDRWTPVAVSGLSGVVAVAAGYAHSLAVRSDGTVWAWGDNWYGQLGDGTKTDRLTPVAVSGLTGVTALDAGAYHSLAVLSDGSACAWGANWYGQLGDGTTTNRSTPVPVSGLSNVAAVSAGCFHNLALLTDGSVRSWGNNGGGQLGDGTETDRLTPVAVSGLSGIFSVAAGGYHCLAVSSIQTARISVSPAQGTAGSDAVLTADLFSLSDPMPGRVLDFRLNGDYLGSPITDAAGRAQLTITVPPGAPQGWYPVDVSFAGAPDLLACDGRGWMEVVHLRTSLVASDRVGTITELVTLRAYLRDASSGAWLNGKTIAFSIDGTDIGTAVTAATGTRGRADLNWMITSGPPIRVIGAWFAGDSDYDGSFGNARLTCQSWGTKMVAFDRTARITDQTELKCRLLRSDNAPLYNKTINFYVDGTFVIARPTNVSGYASYPYYVVPDGAGAGARTILSEWVGNAGYAACSKTATLTVLKAIPYIWVLPKTIPQGAIANLYALFRRLYDYQKQVGKTVDFKMDGTVVQTMVTDATGVARYLYRTTEPPGVYTIRCEFAGDAWVDAGYGEAHLTID